MGLLVFAAIYWTLLAIFLFVSAQTWIRRVLTRPKALAAVDRSRV